MSGWNFFFTLLGVLTMTAQLFRLIDMIERPCRRQRRRSGSR